MNPLNFVGASTLQEIDVEHLLLALLRQTDGTTAPLLGKVGASPQVAAKYGARSHQRIGEAAQSFSIALTK